MTDYLPLTALHANEIQARTGAMFPQAKALIL